MQNEWTELARNCWLVCIRKDTVRGTTDQIQNWGPRRHFSQGQIIIISTQPIRSHSSLGIRMDHLLMKPQQYLTLSEGKDAE